MYTVASSWKEAKVDLRPNGAHSTPSKPTHTKKITCVAPPKTEEILFVLRCSFSCVDPFLISSFVVTSFFFSLTVATLSSFLLFCYVVGFLLSLLLCFFVLPPSLGISRPSHTHTYSTTGTIIISTPAKILLLYSLNAPGCSMFPPLLSNPLDTQYTNATMSKKISPLSPWRWLLLLLLLPLPSCLSLPLPQSCR